MSELGVHCIMVRRNHMKTARMVIVNGIVTVSLLSLEVGRPDIVSASEGCVSGRTKGSENKAAALSPPNVPSRLMLLGAFLHFCCARSVCVVFFGSLTETQSTTI